MVIKRNNSTCLVSVAVFTATLFSSCVPSVGSNMRSRESSGLSSGSSNVAIYQGKILADNPIILSKNSELPDTFDLNKLMSTATITTNSFLKGNESCFGLNYCFEVRQNKDAPSALQTVDGKWAFNANTPEFLQVNTFYHLNSISDMFYKNLTSLFFSAYDGANNTQYDTAIPLDLKDSITQKYKMGGSPLIAYADCDQPDNAYFDRATQTLCFGYINAHPNVKWAQDSSAIYHETGHFFQKLQLNFRNFADGTILQKSDMGNIYYDEAGSIGEGLSDFYSFYVNGRTHFSEWGAGRFLQASRPMIESDPLHAPGLGTDVDKRLSYPQYIDYNPNNPSIPSEDIHLSGMIISHYLVALVQDLQDKCNLTKRESSDYVVQLISESLAELGDLTTKGTERNTSGSPKINLSKLYASDWFNKVNPINFRSFTQTFAKNLKNTVNINHCSGATYTNDQLESLIDQYGLLLFRTYNENRNLLTGVNTPVNPINRKKSQLISKDQIILDPTPNASIAFVIDNKDQIKEGINSLQSIGTIGSLSPQTPSDLGFNNNNGKISPGEVVALALNLYNKSNSTIGGVQVLANDWNQADATGKPCQFDSKLTNDTWPLKSEGGVPCSDIKADASSNFAPVCFMQLNEATATKWVSQKEFRNKMALDNSFCLDSTDDKDCFIRAIKGADQAYFSKINPTSTWGKTLADPTTGKAPSLYWGNLMLFEISKHIPPGTVIDCRMRVRFTNCEDCYHDKDKNNNDFKDSEYNGPKPFKIIHLQIPITD